MRLRAEKFLSASQDQIGEVTLNEYELSHIGEDVAVAVAHRQHRNEVLWAWSCILNSFKGGKSSCRPMLAYANFCYKCIRTFAPRS